MTISKLISPVQQNRWLNPPTDVRLWQTSMTRSPLSLGSEHLGAIKFRTERVGTLAIAVSRFIETRITCGSYTEPSRRRSWQHQLFTAIPGTRP